MSLNAAATDVRPSSRHMFPVMGLGIFRRDDSSEGIGSLDLPQIGIVISQDEIKHGLSNEKIDELLNAAYFNVEMPMTPEGRVAIDAETLLRAIRDNGGNIVSALKEISAKVQKAEHKKREARCYLIDAADARMTPAWQLGGVAGKKVHYQITDGRELIKNMTEEEIAAFHRGLYQIAEERVKAGADWVGISLPDGFAMTNGRLSYQFGDGHTVTVNPMTVFRYGVDDNLYRQAQARQTVESLMPESLDALSGGMFGEFVGHGLDKIAGRFSTPSPVLQ